MGMADNADSGQGACGPGVGELFYDLARDRVGEVVARQGRQAILRSSGGGPTWEADYDGLRPANAYDRLRARVNELNARRL
jgi:hypothetical protein